MKEENYEVYDSRDKAILFTGSKQQCINYMDSELTFGESEYVWFRKVTA